MAPNSNRTILMCSTALMALTALAGCAAADAGGDASSASGAGDYADLVRAAGTSDVLPEGVSTTVDGASLKADSVRLAAEFEDQLVFLATADADGGESVCMVVTDASGSDAQGTCEIEGGSLHHAGQTYFLIPDGAGAERLPQDIAVEQLSDNVYVSPGVTSTSG